MLTKNQSLKPMEPRAKRPTAAENQHKRTLANRLSVEDMDQKYLDYVSSRLSTSANQEPAPHTAPSAAAQELNEQQEMTDLLHHYRQRTGSQPRAIAKK